MYDFFGGGVEWSMGNTLGWQPRDRGSNPDGTKKFEMSIDGICK